MAITEAYKTGHVKGELGRGLIHRCPKSWLRTARKVARETDPNLAAAIDIALAHYDDVRGFAEHREMRRLAGRRLS